MESSKRHISTTDDLQKANELNDLKFQTHDFSNQCNTVRTDSLKDDSSIWPEVDSYKV